MNQPEYKKEDGSLWQYFHKDFQGYEIIFRQNVVTGLIQMMDNIHGWTTRKKNLKGLKSNKKSNKKKCIILLPLKCMVVA